MFRPRTSNGRERKAIILLIVITLLTLFAVVGLTFVLYAENQSNSQRIWREARTASTGPALGAEDLLNNFLRQLIYDLPDDSTGVMSSVRGHSLARSMYGWTGTIMQNTTPYNGFGPPRAIPGPLGGQDYQYVNYQYFPEATPFIRDPERVQPRSGSPTPWLLPVNAPYVAKNAPYTYPDENNMFLATIDPRSGRVITPSFHRDWVFGGPWTAATPNATSAIGKYLTLRPRPAENPLFPYPQQDPLPATFGPPSTGDVENLGGKIDPTTGAVVQQNDSYWIDFDSPVQQLGGKNYKALAAALVLDYDGRLNLNAHGNLMSQGTAHASNQGWGPWEVSLQRLLNQTTPIEAANIIKARYGSTIDPANPAPTKIPVFNPPLAPYPGPKGHFDPAPNPDPGLGTATAGTPPPDYSKVDFDGSFFTNGGGQPKVSYNLQGQASFPSYPERYLNGFPLERTNHALVFNPFLLTDGQLTLQTYLDDTIYGVKDMFLLNYKFTGDSAHYQQAAVVTKGLSTILAKDPLLPADLPNRRHLVTTLSADLDRLSNSPWAWNTITTDPASQYRQPPSGFPSPPPPPPATVLTPPPFAQGGIASPVPGGPQSPINPVFAGPPYTTPSDGYSEFSPNWQAASAGFRDYQNGIVAGLGSIDLNRNLWSYYDPANPTPTFDAGRYARATAERQRFARDIFFRLAAATGTWIDPNAWASPEDTTKGAVPKNPPERYNALRWLAQLAVNIVDYIDTDDIMTPFQWDPGDSTQWVFGTELPRLVINESFMQYENDPADPGLTGAMPSATYYRVKCWLELHNPLTPPGGTSSLMSENGGARLVYNGTSCYRILLTKSKNTFNGMRNPANVKGDPDANPADQVTIDFLSSNTQVIPPSDPTQYANSSFFVVGPAPVPGGTPRPVEATLPGLQYDVQKATLQGNTDNPGKPPYPGFLLQRLACPYMPFDATTNPYVTVDYVQYTVLGQLNDALDKYDINGQQITTPNPIDQRHAWGRVQPYAGDYDQNYPPGPTPQTLLRMININPPPAATDFNHTFGRHNGQGNSIPNAPGDGNLNVPFDWLAHLDRALVSPVELFNVSAWHPHELTQQFITRPIGSPAGPTPPKKFQHMAAWNEPIGLPTQITPDMSRLFRALGYLHVRDRTLGMGIHGRVPGRINLNTAWDESIFQAIADGDDTTNNSGNHFTTAQVQAMWQQFLQFRSPQTTLTPTATYQVWGNDRPLLPPSAPIYPTGDTQNQYFTTVAPPVPPIPQYAQTGGYSGVARTILNSGFNVTPTTPPTPPQVQHPYEHYELLNKIFNRVTTRSNVFAVWVTFGYFEVTNPGPWGPNNRPILGKEMLDASGAPMPRDQFFAILDRTNIAVDASNFAKQGPKPIFFSFESDDATPAVGQTLPVTATVKLPGMTVQTDPSNGVTSLIGYYEGERWIIISEFTPGAFDGTPLRIDIGGQEEVLQAGAAGIGPDNVPYIKVRCQKPHPRGALMMINSSILGNPGPQPTFSVDDAKYKSVVRYFAKTK
jgi:hypothetical protein